MDRNLTFSRDEGREMTPVLGVNDSPNDFLQSYWSSLRILQNRSALYPPRRPTNYGINIAPSTIKGMGIASQEIRM